MSGYTMNDLSAAAAFALCYAQAIVYGPSSVQARRYHAALKTLSLTAVDRRHALAKGLAELTEMGIIECKRDGEGDLVPTKLHEELVGASSQRLVLRDFD